jgi:uncharacterized membrane protein
LDDALTTTAEHGILPITTILELNSFLVATCLGTLHVPTVGTATAGTGTGPAHGDVVSTVSGVLIRIVLDWRVDMNRDAVQKSQRCRYES